MKSPSPCTVLKKQAFPLRKRAYLLYPFRGNRTICRLRVLR